jgi:DUF1680 family protein
MSRLKPVRFVDVSMEGTFWRERLDTVLASTIPSQHARLAEHGLLESLKVMQPPPPFRIPPKKERNFTTQIFWDSDVGKWIEAAGYALSHRRDATIEAKVDASSTILPKHSFPTVT